MLIPQGIEEKGREDKRRYYGPLEKGAVCKELGDDGGRRSRICGGRETEFIGREAGMVVVGLNRNWGQLAVSRRVLH